MNKLQYNTYKFGNLIISKIEDEITILYKGKKKIFSKVIPIGFLAGRKKYIYLLSVISCMLVLVFYVYRNIDFHSHDNAQDSIDKDEQEKIELLLSSKTDYSVQQKQGPLKVREHVVQDGDTLSEIAKEYGVSMDTICGSNNLHSYDFINTGRILKIPNKDGIIHEVKKGQNIIEIAKYYKVSVEKIFAENDIKNFDFISAGDVVFVPDAKPLNIVPGFLWPAQSWRITSAYGWRRNPINGLRHFHEGLDIRSNYQLVKASRYGKVTYTGWLGGYGNVLVIAHPGGWKTLYGHLSRFMVKPGQYVKQGQWIARSGNTGSSTGPHLHFEIMRYGKHYNPYKYLRK